MPRQSVAGLRRQVIAERKARVEEQVRMARAMRRVADEHDWCSEFDDLLHDVGLDLVLPRTYLEVVVRMPVSSSASPIRVEINSEYSSIEDDWEPQVHFDVGGIVFDSRQPIQLKGWTIVEEEAVPTV